MDQLEDTNNERLSRAMPHSGLKSKNENDPKKENDIRWKMTFHGRQPLKQPFMEDDLQWKMTFNGR